MLNRFRKWLGGGQGPKSQALPQGIPAPEQRREAGISYDADLVPALKRDHVDLVGLYVAIGDEASRGDFQQVPQMLMSFKMHFEGHLIAENVRFYNYVENAVSHDPETTDLVRSFRKEMNAIAKGVVDFVKKYQLPDFDQKAREEFMAEYRVVGGLLTQRVEREEMSLYPLYQRK